MPAGEFSKRSEISPPLNVPLKSAQQLNGLNASTLNDIKGSEIFSEGGDFSEDGVPRPEYREAALMRRAPTRSRPATRPLGHRPVNRELPVGRDIDRLIESKSYLAQKKELAAKLAVLICGPADEKQGLPGSTDSLFTWTADVMLKSGMDPNRSDAAEIYGKMNAPDKQGEEIPQCGEATATTPGHRGEDGSTSELRR